jgi:hypothetical protein
MAGEDLEEAGHSPDDLDGIPVLGFGHGVGSISNDGILYHGAEPPGPCVIERVI